jgi:hypothetical protein
MIVALATVFLALRGVLDRLPLHLAAGGALIHAAAAGAIQLAFWTTVGAQVRAVQACTERWPEVEHLAGARMQPAAQDMRDLVHLVRRLAPDASDSVLLLPEDPGVEAWFERPRPRLSSAIIFSDQYWNHYVHLDFMRLTQDPPAVIIIGPGRVGRRFASLWSGSVRRLMRRIEADLLPRRYSLAAAHPIQLPSGEDRMEVYVLKRTGTGDRRPLAFPKPPS